MPTVDLVVADTMGLWIDVARPELESLLSRVHGVVMNEEEAASSVKEKKSLQKRMLVSAQKAES